MTGTAPGAHALADSVGTGLRYRVAWRSVEPPDRAAPAGSWLVVVPAGHAADPAVEGAVRALNGARVVTVDARSADRQTLASALESRPAGILSLLALDDRPRPGHPAVSSGLASTLGLLQALADTGGDAKLWCLTRGAVATGPGEHVTAPAQAQCWGLGFVAALEHPELWGGLIDLDDAPFPDSLPVGGEDQLALRGGRMFVRRVVPAPDPAEHAAVPGWSPEGTVLITGGTGGLGAEAARLAAAGGAGHVLLLSRRGPGAPGAGLLRADLEALGARVTIEACDVADRDRVAQVLAAVPSGLPVTSVLHAAGADHLRPLMATELRDLSLSLSAKVLGAEALDELTADAPVASFVGFSSVAGVWGGGGGLAGYAAANAHLDALLDRRRGRGLAATAVAWGPWSGAGMAADNAAETRTLRRFGLIPMDPAPALAALRRTLVRHDPQAVLADVDWERFALAYTYQRPSSLFSELAD